MTPWIYLAIALMGYPLAWLWHKRRLETVFMRGTRVLTEQVATLQVGVERAREDAEAARGRAARYFVEISEFERQRDGWHRLHQEESIGHGNAQNLMMRTIEEMGRLLASKGIRYQIPRVLHAVREEFLQTHELPARENLPLDQRVARMQPPPTTEPL